MPRPAFPAYRPPARPRAKQPAWNALWTALILCLLIPSALFSRQANASRPPAGTIKGRVIDLELKSPVPQALVRIKGTARETLSDAQGGFEFLDLPAGSYILEVSCPHYLALDKADIIVKSARATQVEVELALEGFGREEKEVTVTAGYFAQAGAEPPSATGFSYEEMRRAAGAAGDVSRVVGALPSVAQTNDMVNGLVVRGGSPAENAFFIDNIEVPNINHYPVLGSTAGAIGLLNIDFIRDVTFSAGAFAPQFGDRLSSVMDISFREPDLEALDFQLELSMMGAGVVAEGPIARGRSGWMFSARRSYIDLLIDLMGQGVPVHWSDFQGKATFDLSPKHRLTFLGLAGVDDSGTRKEDALKDGESFYGGLDTVESTAGLNWRAIWGERGYSNTSLAFSSSRYKDTAWRTESEILAREGDSRERAVSLRNVNSFRLSPSTRILFGVEAKRLTADSGMFLAEAHDVLGNLVPSSDRHGLATADRLAAFSQVSWNPVRGLTFNLGFRLDHSFSLRRTGFSPRVSVAVEPKPGTTLQAAAGIYVQPLPLALIVQKEAFKGLADPRARHYVLGVRQLLSPSVQLTIEGYLKEYSRFPLDPEQPSLFIFDELFYSGTLAPHETLVDAGRARSYGLELTLQKKLSGRIYGLVSAAWFRTRYSDLTGTWRDRVYDNRWLVSAEGGWRAGGGWEFGLKFVSAGGAPYTPFDLVASRAFNSGFFDGARINAARLPAYLALNLRADKRFNFRASNLILSLSLWNVSNRKNVTAYTWNTVRLKPVEVLGWGILPVLGVEFEF